MIESRNFLNSKEYCKIRETKPKNTNNELFDSDKVFLYFGSFIHRTSFAAWDLSGIVNKLWAKFVTVDWPKTEFEKEKVMDQLLEYIKNNKDKEFIIAGLSFWEIVARNLFERLNEEEKHQIKLYISICWVSEWGLLNLPKYIDLIKRVNKKILEILTWTAWKIDRCSLWNTSKRFISRKAVERSREIVDNVWMHRIERHIKAASLWINPWLADRLLYVLEQDATECKNNEIETAILYSENDQTFDDPKQNALCLQKMHKKSILVNLWKAGHAALVERPEKYNEVLRKLLEDKWGSFGEGGN
ncbi:MAG: hypothetical protein ACD_3C00225G0004 [uncultured bacterium (gcode 4)]|uniref:Uncharacterized protein n=1 Tax=uncultured bacterium (gcode 4) TaxID=1234023 RepID=K2F806_9BACT|nr:MAG: hypothetical protein ACD_3C00225G0004 [uncultured bacterium (gcode 4)]